MQQSYLTLLETKLVDDSRVAAAWLEGSFGRGNADRYADLDIHLLLTTTGVADFRAGVEAWLNDLRPLVLFTLLFDGQMVNALTVDGLRVDVWLHSGDHVALDGAKAKLICAQPGVVTWDAVTPAKEPAQIAAGLQRQLKEFWRCISLLPSVIGRRELIISLMGLGVEINLLGEILTTGYGVARDTGVKNLNRFLPGDTQAALEAALNLHGLTQQSLAQAHLGLAHIAQQHGRLIAQRHGFAYPHELEAAVLRYVEAELEFIMNEK